MKRIMCGNTLRTRTSLVQLLPVLVTALGSNYRYDHSPEAIRVGADLAT